MFCMSGRHWLFCHPQVYHLGLLKNMLPAWILYILTSPSHTWKKALNLTPFSPQFLSELQEIFYLFIFKVFFPTSYMRLLAAAEGKWLCSLCLECWGSLSRAAGTVLSQTPFLQVSTHPGSLEHIHLSRMHKLPSKALGCELSVFVCECVWAREPLQGRSLHTRHGWWVQCTNILHGTARADVQSKWELSRLIPVWQQWGKSSSWVPEIADRTVPSSFQLEL